MDRKTRPPVRTATVPATEPALEPGPDAAVAATPAPLAEPSDLRDFGDRRELGRDVFAALAESRAAMTGGLAAAGSGIAEWASLGIDVAVRAAAGSAAARTWSDAVALGVDVTRVAFDAVAASAAAVAEIGVEIAVASYERISGSLAPFPATVTEPSGSANFGDKAEGRIADARGDHR